MISELFAKYQFGAIHRYAGRYGKVMTDRQTDKTDRQTDRTVI